MGSGDGRWMKLAQDHVQWWAKTNAFGFVNRMLVSYSVFKNMCGT